MAIFFIVLIGVWKIWFYVPSPILGVYSRPGRRGIFKQIFMYLLLKLRKKSSNNKDDVGMGVKRTQDIQVLESIKVKYFEWNTCNFSYQSGAWTNSTCN